MIDHKSVTSCVCSHQRTLVGHICVHGFMYFIAHKSSPDFVGEITYAKLWLTAGANPDILLGAGG
jgi:hypothetical protein